jgi:molecular chaperone IbpA
MCFKEDVAMRTFDFSPFARNAIGFETLFDRLNDRSHESSDSYPPYDIVRKGEDAFQINLALAGFAPNDITITSEASQLTVAGRKSDSEGTEYLYQGISARAFERRFNLADYIEVENASFENGLLHINLVRRVPERMKPRRIDIGERQSPVTKGSGKSA